MEETYAYTPARNGVPKRISPRVSGRLPSCQATIELQHEFGLIPRCWTSWTESTLYSRLPTVMIIGMLASQGTFYSCQLEIEKIRGHVAHPSAGVRRVALRIRHAGKDVLCQLIGHVDSIKARVH